MHKPNKYRSYGQINIVNRTWPDQVIKQAPRWCSVDLRDGNQALVTPMSIEEKIEYFKMLVKIGFKEIEIAFPSASQIEFDFVQTLIKKQLIPADVTIQVLVQAREDLIQRTVESLQGANRPIIHMYNSTSKQQREIVFQKSKQQIIDLAVQGVIWIKEYAAKYNLPIGFEYTPESFTGTELDFALEICNAVIETYKPTPSNKITINLPATVELSTPNVYADAIEWMNHNLDQRDNLVLSVHTHNDRGCAVAAAELAMLAGAERVEGTLFGNGERTGNVDLVTLALNLFTQGIDPKLNFENLNEIKATVERINRISLSQRQPYAGDLVHTAFSGSHQDAINKGFKYQKDKSNALWDVPYLPIDPADIGQTYESIIRLNSQSGKGGITYILKNSIGLEIPRGVQLEFAKIVQTQADNTGKEIETKDLIQLFQDQYFSESKIKLNNIQIIGEGNNNVQAILEVKFCDEKLSLQGIGNGPLEACQNALTKILGFNIISYSEDSLGTVASAKAEAYVEIQVDNKKYYGVGLATSITRAAINALFSAINRALLSKS